MFNEEGRTINDTSQKRQEPPFIESIRTILAALPGYRFAAACAGRILQWSSRPLFRLAIRVLLTLLFVVLVNRSIAGADLAALMRSVSPPGLLAALFLGAGSFYFQVLRWQCILAGHDLPAGAGVALRTIFRGFFLGFVTPGRMGELFRAMHLDPHRKLATMAATVEERFCSVVVTVFAGMVGMVLLWGGLGVPPFMPLAAASILFTVGFILFTGLLLGGAGSMVFRLPVLRRLQPVLVHFERYRSLPFGRLGVYSIAAHLLLLLQVALLFSMFGERDLPLTMAALAQAFSFMLLLPFFIANIGLREYAFSFFLARAHHSDCGSFSCSAVALGVATIILFVNIILPAAIGLFWVYLDKQADQRIAIKEDNDDAT